MIIDNRIKDQESKDQRIINWEIIGSRIKELIMQRSKDLGSKIQGLMINDQVLNHSMEDQRINNQKIIGSMYIFKDQRIDNPEIIGSKVKWLIIKGSRIKDPMTKDQRSNDWS